MSTRSRCYRSLWHGPEAEMVRARPCDEVVCRQMLQMIVLQTFPMPRACMVFPRCNSLPGWRTRTSARPHAMPWGLAMLLPCLCAL